MLKNSENLEKLEGALGYSFHDRALLQLALTHTSYANEHKEEGAGDNERLEFLGDAVLETICSEYLYRRHPEKNEGGLSMLRASIVCEPTLALCAHDFDLSDYLVLGNGENQSGGRYRDSIVSDAMEAVIGAVYLDGGFEAAERFISMHILKDIGEKQLFVDSKTNLQEIVQAEEKQINYVLVREEGPDHDKIFTMEAVIDGETAGVGTGRTKKAAEQHAAFEAIKKLRGKID